jgi:transposase-like protein
MSIVWRWQELVSNYVEAGKSVVVPVPACPGCGRRLGRWSGYWRWLRSPGIDALIWIWRARCTPCRVSHALLPDFLFHRRLDEVVIIGQVLALAAVQRAPLRALARRFDLPRATVRAWWGRFRTRSPTVLAELLDVAVRLNSAPVDLQLNGEAAVFEALDQAISRARIRFGERIGDAWRFWSRISGGRVLATNTSASWRHRPDRSWMAASR